MYHHLYYKKLASKYKPLRPLGSTPDTKLEELGLLGSNREPFLDPPDSKLDELGLLGSNREPFLDPLRSLGLIPHAF